jgi:ABC-type cobalamin/Fe3+-siderophores transport system ATPase subunit
LASSGSALLSARNVSFAYAGRRGWTASRAAVRNVSIDVGPGTFVGVLGPNGSGKTTLLKLLGRLLAPDEGTVTLDGKPIADWPRHAVASRIAMVPQETHPAFDYTVLELVLMGRYPHLGALAIEGPLDLAIARDALRATGMSAFETRPFSTLSGGEKQRVVIAGALAQQADVLLLDEPTASLDPGHQLEIADLLSELNRTRGLGLVLSTHDLNLAASVCRDLLMLSEGSAIGAGPTGEVLTSANVERLYGIRADVRFHPQAGHLTVVPLRNRS